MMKKLLIVCLLLVGCDKFTSTPLEDAQTIRYVKDKRTGLCFAYNYVSGSAQGGGGEVLTHVPCTPEVEALIPSK
jgi:hypothetical protein